VRADRDARLYADPERVHKISHRGKQYRIDAVHLCEPSPQRTPVLYQAGASDRGRAFAAHHAECIFVNPSTKANVRRLVTDLRTRAEPRQLKVFLGTTVVVGRTAREAQDKLADYRKYASVDGALAHAAASLGIDFARFGLDEPVDGSASQAIQSNVDAIARAIGPNWTTRQLIDRFVLGSRQLPITGDPDQVVDELVSWVTEGDVDGFNLSRTVVPECLEDFIALVVPRLQERGLYKREYATGTYREKLFGGPARLVAPHPAVKFRSARLTDR